MQTLGLLAAIALAAALPAAAQTVPADRRAEYDAAFQDTLKNPSDPETAFRFARLAVRVGDLRGAISALERLLVVDADQPNVKLELGVLYFRLGSNQAARDYLESAQASVRADAATRQHAGQVLAEIDERTRRSRFSGETLTGFGYSTNANSGPAGLIQSLGTNVVPTPDVSRQPDFNAVAAATLRHRYDLGRQDMGTLESVLEFYTTHQFQVSQANVLLLDFTTGPRASPFESGALDSMTVRPFLTGRYIAVQDMAYYWAWGGGAEFAMPIGQTVNATVTGLARQRDYLNNPTVPTNDQSSGVEGTLTTQVDVELNSSMTLSLTGLYSRYWAVVPAQAFTTFGVGGSLEVRFDGPIGVRRPWAVTASAGLARWLYDQPDPAVDPNTGRTQTDLSLGLMLTVPLTERIAFTGQVNYVQRTASLNTYAYDALSSLVAIGVRF
jgi:hypothetical protein